MVYRCTVEAYTFKAVYNLNIFFYLLHINIKFTKILFFSQTHWRPIIDPWETDMHDQRPIGDLNMLYRRPTCRLEAHWRLTCLCGDPPETDMPEGRPIGDLNMLHWRPLEGFDMLHW